LPAIQVRFNATAITGLDVGDILTARQNFDAKFVTWNSRELEEWKFPEVTADISSADAHPMNADEDFAGAWSLWFRNLDSLPGFDFADL
jgi:hypothetical protein